MTTSEKLCSLRRKRSLSQEQLAAVLGVTRQSVSKWETGDSLPDTDRLLALSRFYHVSVDYLLHDDWETDRYAYEKSQGTDVPSDPEQPVSSAPETLPRSSVSRRDLVLGILLVLLIIAVIIWLIADAALSGSFFGTLHQDVIIVLGILLVLALIVITSGVLRRKKP